MRTQIEILKDNKREEILRKLNEQYGITKIPGMLLTKNSEKIFLFQGSLDEKKIKEIEKTIPIERIGVYLGKIAENERIRLSLEGSQILKNQINKNIFEMTKSQLDEWIKGNEILVKNSENFRDFLIMKYQDDFFGTGKASENKITNFIPKSRRLKERKV
jgi:NOL1/NOP2/fmu family ribosome biogenesis protein